MNDKDFTHLHVHTDYSLLDGLGKVEDYVGYAKELGMKALAFTDHGTAAGLVTAYDECKKRGIKFIGGCEFYVAPDGTSRFDKTKQEDKAYNHLIVLFKNEIGYKNGCFLVTRSNTEGFYYKPRIDFELLKEHSEGLVVLSACVAGAVPQLILKGDRNGAKEMIMKYKEVFGDDYYLEIQDHGLSSERIVINEMLSLSKECGVKLVATNDCHYVRKDDKEAHDWLLCMQTDKKVDDENRMRYEGYYHLKSKQEMLDLFPYCTEAIYNTQEIVDKCNFEFSYGNYRMPTVHIPESYNGDFFKYMEDEAWKGFDERYPAGHRLRESAKQRLEYELGVIKQMNFAEYFLDIRKTIKSARDNGILVGPGRGSGAGSCMNYCLGITDLEPLQYNLLFERFLNPERISMPDIDTDFEFLRKDDVIAAEANDYGFDHFAKIRTFVTMKAKAILKSCAKVSGIADHVAIGNKLAKFIIDNNTLEDEWKNNSELQTYVHSDPLLEKIWNISLKLENTKKSASTHACGHIPTPVPCEELFPCGVDSETGYLICEYDMTQAEHLGNLKKDLLMLRNLTIIDAAQKAVEKRYGIKIPLWTEDILNDKEALKLISRGDTDGVFQLESDGMKQFMRQLKPSCFEDIIAGVALYRPGPMSYIPDYVENKHNPAGIRYITPELEEILSPTYGIIIYQEQVISIVQKLAGFSMGRADVVRKAMGKKKQDIMDAEAPNFISGNSELGIEGCVSRGIPEAAAKAVWDQMVDFAKYAFNKSHSAAYAAIAMQTAYLKAHYPVEFAAGLLTSVMDDSDKIMKYVASFKKIGIKVLPPDVKKSEYAFSIESDDQIRFGLFAIKGVGMDVATGIQNDAGEYEDLEDFVSRHLDYNKKAFENLIKAGALDSFGYNRKTLLENINPMIKRAKDAQEKFNPDQITLFDIGLLEAQPDKYALTEYPEDDFLRLCRNEKDATGMYISGHPASYIEKVCQKHGAVPIGDLIDENSVYDNDEEVAIGGVITNIERKITKKGNRMLIITVEDVTGSISILAFEPFINDFNFEEDELVFIKGKLRGSGEDSSIVLKSAQHLHDTKRVLWIGTDDNSLVNLEKKVVSFIGKNPGFGDVVRIASKKTKDRRELCEINLTDDLLVRAKISFGDKNVAVTECH